MVGVLPIGICAFRWGRTPIAENRVGLCDGHMSNETLTSDPTTKTGQSPVLTVIGWLLVVPLGAAVINTIYAFGVAYLTDMNEETTSWMRVGAVVLLILAIPFALGGRALIRRGRRISNQSHDRDDQESLAGKAPASP